MQTFMNYNSQQIKDTMEKKKAEGEMVKAELNNPALTESQKAGKTARLNIIRDSYLYWKLKLEKMEPAKLL